MKVLVVCSRRYYAPYTDYIAPFIYEQVNSLRNLGVEFDYYRVEGGGIKSYVKAIGGLRKKIKEYQPDIIHAHYGLCGIPANIQRKIPVVTTFHGSDVNNSKTRWISKLISKLSSFNIYVSDRLYAVAGKPSKSVVIPCGFNAESFDYLNKVECRKQLGWEENHIYVLFSKEFTDVVKNYPLAKAAVDRIEGATLVELYGYTREQMPLVLNASDVLIMTSFTEGSPQIIKEAVACGCPIVSTDVGDVSAVIEGVNNTYLCSYEVDDVYEKLKKCLAATNRMNDGKQKLIEQYSLESVANRIKGVYDTVCCGK